MNFQVFTYVQLRFGTSVNIITMNQGGLTISSEGSASPLNGCHQLPGEKLRVPYLIRNIPTYPKSWEVKSTFCVTDNFPFSWGLRIWGPRILQLPSLQSSPCYTPPVLPLGLCSRRPRLGLLSSEFQEPQQQWDLIPSVGFGCWPQDYTISAKQMACANVQCVSVHFDSSIQFLSTDQTIFYSNGCSTRQCEKKYIVPSLPWEINVMKINISKSRTGHTLSSHSPAML